MKSSVKLLTAALCSLALCSIASAQMEKPKLPDAAKKVVEGMKPQEKKDDHAHPAPPNMDAQMKAWAEASTPGEMHAWLGKMAGNWDAEVKAMMPGAPETTSKATMVVTMAMGGRFSHSMVKGEFMGQPFEGAGITGYDNSTKKFQSSWADNMGTMMMMSTGDLSADKKTLTLKSEFMDPAEKKMIKSTETTTWVDDNHLLMEFFHEMDGKQMKVMSISYTRAKAAEGGKKETTMTDKAKDEMAKKAKELEERAKKTLPTGK